MAGILVNPSYGGTIMAISHANSATDWTVYHHDPLGSGVDSSGTSLSPFCQPGLLRSLTAKSTVSRSKVLDGCT